MGMRDIRAIAKTPERMTMSTSGKKSPSAKKKSSSIRKRSAASARKSSAGRAEANAGDDAIVVPREVADEYLGIRKASLQDAKRFYFENIMPLLRGPLEAYPDHQQIRDKGYKTLVSLMGFSPETTVHAAIIIRPEKLIVAYSHDGDGKAQQAAEHALEYLIRERLISRFNLDLVPINAFDPQDIYDKLRSKLLDNEQVVIDITGGTKVMSATAGALAWESNLPMCYLDGGWVPEHGAAGMSRLGRLELKANPSRLRGYQYRAEALTAYSLGNFVVAEERFAASRKLIDDSFFDLLGIGLCRCYMAFADFDGERLKHELRALKDTLEIGAVRRLCHEGIDIDAHVQALESFANEDELATVAGFAELADLYRLQKRYDFSGLLWYRTIEALVEYRLSHIAPGFRLNRPDWEGLSKTLGFESVTDLEQQFTQFLNGMRNALPNKVDLLAGFTILCLATDLTEHWGEGKPLKRLTRLGEIRNSSYLAHGKGSLSEEAAQELCDGASGLAVALLGDHHDPFHHWRLKLAPRGIGTVQPEEAND
jgi:hypothetical protein